MTNIETEDTRLKFSESDDNVKLTSDMNNYISNQSYVQDFKQNSKPSRIAECQNNYQQLNSSEPITLDIELNAIINSFVYIDYDINDVFDFSEYLISSSQFSDTHLLTSSELQALDITNLNSEPVKHIYANLLLKFIQQSRGKLNYQTLQSFITNLYIARQAIETDQSSRVNDLKYEMDILESHSNDKYKLVKSIISFIIHSLICSSSNIDDLLNHFTRIESSPLYHSVPSTLINKLTATQAVETVHHYHRMSYDKSFNTLLNLIISRYSIVCLDNYIHTNVTSTSSSTSSTTIYINDEPITNPLQIASSMPNLESSNLNIKFDYSSVTNQSLLKLLHYFESLPQINNRKQTYKFISSFIPNVSSVILFYYAIRLYNEHNYQSSINALKFISSNFDDSLLASSPTTIHYSTTDDDYAANYLTPDDKNKVLSQPEPQSPNQRLSLINQSSLNSSFDSHHNTTPHQSNNQISYYFKWIMMALIVIVIVATSYVLTFNHSQATKLSSHFSDTLKYSTKI